MKRVLLITAVGLLLASNAMADMRNAAFALHRKPTYTGATAPFFMVGPSGELQTSLFDCPSVLNNADPYQPNWSPNWNRNNTELDTTAAKVFNPLPCSQYLVHPVGANAQNAVYVVVSRAGSEGVSGVSFGVDWTPTTYLSSNVAWQSCTDGLSFPNPDPVVGIDFPGRKGGVRITWQSCQNFQIPPNGVHAVVGYFKMKLVSGTAANLVLSVTPNNNLASGAELSIADCTNRETNLYTVWGPTIVQQLLGKVGWGTSAGYNPCLTTPAVQTTWGKVKTLYNQ